MSTLTARQESNEYGEDGSISLVYDYYDAGADSNAAYIALLAALPATAQTWDGKLCVRETYPSMHTVVVDEVTDRGHYHVRARYFRPEVVRQAEEEVTVRVMTTGGTRYLTQAFEHVFDYFSDSWAAEATNHGGTIGVTKDGVGGVDVSDPGISFIIMRRYALANLPATGTLMNLRGKVNSDEVTIYDTRKDRTWTLKAGEILCEGVEESTLDNDNMVTVTFQMAMSQNHAIADGNELLIGDIEDIEKLGWEHLWVEYESFMNDDGFQVSEPAFAHVERVYETVEMDGLGLDGETP